MNDVLNVICMHEFQIGRCVQVADKTAAQNLLKRRKNEAKIQ